MTEFEHPAGPLQGYSENVEARRTGGEVAVIGVGEWARRALLPTLCRLGHSAGFEKLHLVDAYTKPVAPGKSDGLLITTALGDEAVNEILARVEVTHVIVSTPDLTHYDLALRALNRCKHVLVEKTLATSSAQACDLVRLAKDKERLLMVGYQFMYDPRFAAIKQIVHSEEIGEFLEMDAYLFNRPSMFRSGTIGTTVVENHVVHLLSMLQLVLGNATIGDLQVVEAGKERVRVCFTYRGIRIMLAARLDYPGESNYRNFRIHGSRLAIELDFQSFTPKFRVEDRITYEVIKPDDQRYPVALRNVQQVSSLEMELRFFLTRAADGPTPASGGENAVHLTRLMECINNAYLETCTRESHRAKQWKAALRNEIDLLGGAHRGREEPAKTNHLVEVPEPERLIRVVEQVIFCLRSKPYLPVEELARRLSLAPQEIRYAYKVIRQLPRLQSYLRQGPNHDYFEVVDAFFNRRTFEATFFVGLWCPYRCIFCKRQMSSLPVHRSAGRFDLCQSDLMSQTLIERTLDDLSSMHDRGRRITVKVSGGLEPFTDAARVEFIVRGAKRRGLAVKLYSNGALIDTAKNRRVVLAADELRVSLNAVSESTFRSTHLSPSGEKHGTLTLKKIRKVLDRLVDERRSTGTRTRIGLNFVVTQEAANHMVAMARFAARAGLDYVNFNIDYKKAQRDSVFTIIEDQTVKLQLMKERGELSGLALSFGGSLQKGNIFSNVPEGSFDPTGISRYKLFIDPAGHVTPIHEGTFAFIDSRGTRRRNPFVLGRLSDTATLADILDHPHPLSNIGFQYLAPLELILGLEILREEVDARIGIPADRSPSRRMGRPSIAAGP